MNGLIGVALSGTIALVAYHAKRLTALGAVFTVLVGTTIFVTGGWLFTGMMVTFFVTSTIVSRSPGQKKPTRGARQVLANGLVATVMSVLYFMTRDSVFVLLYAASVAIATADTWASELGVHSKSRPRHIILRHEVAYGTDGAVTTTGFLASLLGASLISVFVGGSWIVIAAGFTGSVVDSLLGTMQRQDGGNPATPSRRWLTNDGVNLLSQVLVISGLYALLQFPS
jgi:uncharacterized protein (TIGR00297 family)